MPAKKKDREVFIVFDEHGAVAECGGEPAVFSTEKDMKQFIEEHPEPDDVSEEWTIWSGPIRKTHRIETMPRVERTHWEA